jgi:hypothetical protein
MQRILLPLALAVALTLPADAMAAKRAYAGGIEPSGELSFKLKQKRDRETIKNFAFTQVPIDCAEGAKTTTGHLTFGIRLEGKEFGARADNDEGSRLRVSGKLKQRGKRARGKIRIHGAVPTDDGATGTSCDTGILRWGTSRD